MQEQGISLDEVDQDGNTAVHIAAQHGYLGCIQVEYYLYQKGSLSQMNFELWAIELLKCLQETLHVELVIDTLRYTGINK